MRSPHTVYNKTHLTQAKNFAVHSLYTVNKKVKRTSFKVHRLHSTKTFKVLQWNMRNLYMVLTLDRCVILSQYTQYLLHEFPHYFLTMFIGKRNATLCDIKIKKDNFSIYFSQLQQWFWISLSIRKWKKWTILPWTTNCSWEASFVTLV